MRKVIANPIGQPLRQAIVDLYKTFQIYGLPTITEASEVSVEHQRELYSAQLEQLTPESLERFARKAMTTWGYVNDFRHFLPRIFELLAMHGEVGYTEAEIVLSKLEYGEWTTWPADEQRSVSNYLQALWQDGVAKYPYVLAIDSLLCSIAQAAPNMKPYLDCWMISSSCEAALHFSEFIEISSNRAFTKRSLSHGFCNAFWGSRPKQKAEVAQWILEPSRRQAIETAFFNFSGRSVEVAEQLSAANHFVEWIATLKLPL